MWHPTVSPRRPIRNSFSPALLLVSTCTTCSFGCILRLTSSVAALPKHSVYDNPPSTAALYIDLSDGIQHAFLSFFLSFCPPSLPPFLLLFVLFYVPLHGQWRKECRNCCGVYFYDVEHANLSLRRDGKDDRGAIC